jgi:hypothetical protein
MSVSPATGKSSMPGVKYADDYLAIEELTLRRQLEYIDGSRCQPY